MRRLALIGVFVLLSQLLSSSPVRALQPAEQPVIILSFKASSSTEYVELTNRSDQPIPIDGWRLEYSNVSSSNIRNLAILTGEMPAKGYLVFASTNFVTSYLSDTQVPFTSLLYSGLADSGGFIRLYRPTDDLVNYPDGYIKADEVGWLSSSEDSIVENVVNYTGTTTSLHRCSDLEGVPVDRGDNRLDYYALSEPTLNTVGNLCADIQPPAPDPPIDPAPDPPDPGSEVPEQPLPNKCSGLIISELLPNPSGEDLGNEYIEIQNIGTEPTPLLGCALAVSDGREFSFKDNIEITPGQFLYFSDLETKITLTNSKGLVIYLLDEARNEVSTTEYPPDLVDDQSWALFDDSYSATFTPTPGEINVHQPLRPCLDGYERNPDTGRCNKIIIEQIDTPKTCELGYELNLETGRCRKLLSSLAPCPVGQERNPSTNRCRATESATIVLAACKEGQERNPETNRCRKIVTATELLPCAPGQERNPETNRCRTVSNLTMSGSEEVVEPVASSEGSLIPVGAISVGAVGYMVFEWRSELRKLVTKIRTKFKK